MMFPKKMIQRDNVGIIMAISMGWKSDQCTKMDAPRVKRDPQYYLPAMVLEAATSASLDPPSSRPLHPSPSSESG